MEYKPQSGFLDITHRPKTLSQREHRKLQEAQMMLAHMKQNADYFRKHHPAQWEKAKEVSGELQQMIFRHWSHEELFGSDIQEGQKGQMQIVF